jgi:hypothetical protein
MSSRRREILIGVVGILIAMWANAIPATAALFLLNYPDGDRIRPMGEASSVFAGGLLGLISAAVAFIAVRQPGTRWLGAIGLVLSLTPFPLGVIILRHVIELKHFVILP